MEAGDRHVLVTGGAGFAGSNLAVALKARHPDWRVTAFDNLRRRGSELNLTRLADAGVGFVHGDVRVQADLLSLDRVDAVVECSAEPSVLAGVAGGTAYPVATNLVGAYHCLELCRRDSAQLVFLSTSRVYSLAALRELEVEESETRLELRDEQPVAGASARGISELFPVTGPRTLYGATKLAAELLIEEYRAAFGVRAVVDRCGVLAGPWQMGKAEQGVFAWWVIAHHFGLPLAYVGYGGTGRQVRDLLHIDDLVDVIDHQLSEPPRWDGFVGNVGGGRECSLSLLEATAICEELTGRRLEIGRIEATRAGDVPVYLSDTSSVRSLSGWSPTRDARSTLADVHAWVVEHEDALRRAGIGAAA